MRRRSSPLLLLALAAPFGCKPPEDARRVPLPRTCPVYSVPFAQLHAAPPEAGPWAASKVVAGAGEIGATEVAYPDGSRLRGPEGQLIEGGGEPEAMRRYERVWKGLWHLPEPEGFLAAAAPDDHAYLVWMGSGDREAPERWYIAWRGREGVVAHETAGRCRHGVGTGVVFQYEGRRLAREGWDRWLACLDRMRFWSAPETVDDHGVTTVLAGRRGAWRHEIGRDRPTRASEHGTSRALAECIGVLHDMIP